MTTMQISSELQVASSHAERGELSAWRGSIATANGKIDRVIYTGFARSAAEAELATRSAAKNALATIAFVANSTPVAPGLFEGIAVTANQSSSLPIDISKVSEIGETRWFFTTLFDWEKHPIGHPTIRWPHEMVATGEPYFPRQPWGTGTPKNRVSKKAISEGAASRLIASILWTDPAIRRALASSRKLSVKWGSGFFPGWAIHNTACCAAHFVAWDTDDNAVIKVGNPAAQAVLNLALRARNLGARQQGILSYAPEFTMKLTVPSATLLAAHKSALLRGGKGEWRARRVALNYLKRLGLADLAQDIMIQADAAVPENI